MDYPYLSHWNHWGYNPLTIRGTIHQERPFLPGAASSDLDRVDALGDAASTAPLRQTLRRAQHGGSAAERQRCAKMLEVDQVGISRKTIGKWWFSEIFYGGLLGFDGKYMYPLVICDIAIENGQINSGFEFTKKWCIHI